MQPSVAITLVELGLPMKGIRTALDVEKGMQTLRVSLGLNGYTQDADGSTEI
jgi:rsbT antagonist protein RsbS